MASRPISPAEPVAGKRHPPATTIQPNAHPYAIKTTSSALLSRSNSSPHSAQHTRHHYVPSSPNGTRVSIGGTRVRHRHSSSLSSVKGGVIPAPSPLPTPPSFTTPLPVNRVDEPTPRRTRRAETMPSSATHPIIDLSIQHHASDDQYDYQYQHDNDFEPNPRAELYAPLPPNPKQWNTDELTSYLETSLNIHNHNTHDEDDPNHIGILESVRERGFTGRELLRLTEADLASTPLSDVQRAQLLEHSRTLCSGVLRGHMHIDSYHTHRVSDRSNDIYSRSLRSSLPFPTNLTSSFSVDDLRLSHTHGEEDSNEALFPPSPAMSLHRSNSVSEASAQRYRDLARMRVRRRGRVQGLVETWERASTSGSECSASDGSMSGSDAELESETDPESESSPGPKPEPDLHSDLKSVDLPNDMDSPPTDGTGVVHHPHALPLPPLPYMHTYAARADTGVDAEEPSIEELLASSPDGSLMGARAWEADFGLGETVKRIPVLPVSSGVDVNRNSPSAPLKPEAPSRVSNDVVVQTHGDSVRSKRVDVEVRGSTGSRRKSSRSQKRVVTAIFTGSPSIDVPEAATAGSDEDVLTSTRDVPAPLDEQGDSDAALRTLEASLAATRAQLEALRMRLETVEADTARQEAELGQEEDRSRQSPRSDTRGRRAKSREREEVVEDEIHISALPARDAGALDGMTLGEIARALVTRAMGWVFPYARSGPGGRGRGTPGLRSSGEDKDGSRSPVRRRGNMPVVRVSSYLIWISFAICAVVLRRMGLGRWWVRRP